MPVLSRCVTCDTPLCAQCIVRTPVGFKCVGCTGGHTDDSPRKARSSKGRPVDVDAGPTERSGRRRVIAVVVVAAVVASAIAGYVLRRPTTETLRTGTPGQAAPATVAVQFIGAPGHQLSGDLVLPPRSANAIPGVVIIPDWGAVNRDGMTPDGALPDPLYADLAQVLEAKGVASLRYDPPGHGQSTLPQGSSLRFQDLVTDADAAVSLLAARVEIDPARITVVGDGWGGLVALQLAGQDHRVGRVVLVSTPGRPVPQTLADELQATALSPADAQLDLQQLQSAVVGLLAGGPLPPPSALQTDLRPILQQGQTTYLRTIFGLNPATLAQQVHVPALIVRGGQDPAITAADTQLLAEALGPQSRVRVAAASSATLTITTRTFASVSATVAPPGPTTAGSSMQSFHQPSVIVTISRDDASLDAIAAWILGGSPPS